MSLYSSYSFFYFKMPHTFLCTDRHFFFFIPIRELYHIIFLLCIVKYLTYINFQLNKIKMVIAVEDKKKGIYTKNIIKGGSDHFEKA